MKIVTRTPCTSDWNDGLDARLVRGFMTPVEADAAFTALRTLDWGRDRLRIFGKEQLVPRLSAWYGDAGVAYRYSGVEHVARPYPDVVAKLKDRVTVFTGEPFNFVLANFYRDGDDSMGWHADAEAALGTAPVITSLSFGATRRLRFRRRIDPRATTAVDLEHGALLVMWGDSQRDWQHALPKSKRVREPRINLTFRCIRA